MGLKVGSEPHLVHGRGRNRVLVVSPITGDPNVLWEVDFTTLTPGAGGTLPKSLLFLRNLGFAGGETVQTSASTLLSTGLTAHVPRIGQYGADATTRGLVIDHQESCHGGTARRFDSAGVVGPGGYVNAPGPISPTVTLDFANGPDGTAGADRVQLTAGGMGLFEGAVSTNMMSVWARANGSSDTLTCGRGGNTAQSFALTGDWQRVEVYGQRNISAGTWYIYERAVLTSSPNTARDLILDYRNLRACNTTQNGTSYRFFGETMPSTSSTRNPERLYLASIGDLLDANRLSLEFTLRPKGDAGDYGANMMLWYRDANNLAFINSVDRKVTVTVNGSSFTTTGAIAFARKDKLELWLEAGGGALVTSIKYRVNGGAPVDMGSSGAAQANIASGAAVSLLSTSTGVNGTDRQFSCWAQQIRAYRNNTRPSWAA